jgi:outer membrane protein OmpA-like peptidoglycan-associated protein
MPQRGPEPGPGAEPEQPAAEGGGGKADRAGVMRFLRDRRDPGGLSDAELLERAGTAGGFLGDPSLSAGVRDRLEREQREAERELARRAGGQEQPKPSEPASAEPSAPETPPTAAVEQARRLTDQELRQRVRDSRRQLDRSDVSGDARTRLEGQLAADREELQRRVGANAGGRIPEEAIERPEKAREEATAIVRDTRPARDLPVDDLRERVNRNRALLAVEGLTDDDRRELRRRLAEDREALRERAAAERREERDRDRPDRPRPPGRFDDWDDPDWDRVGDRPGWEDAVADRRPSRALSERELNRRIRATRTAIERGYDGVPRAVLVKRLRDDRGELRRRMRDWRDERDDWWDRHDDDVNIGISIMIVPGLPPYPRPPIEYAEVDDEMLGEWLIAPPTMPIDRRYTVDEIEEYPAIRQAMPGVEIDSIRFGFNQDFVPEEEIGELSRIGEMLEAILRSNPGEVFLIEGHTDAVGSAGYNLDLSRRRAASVKVALTDFFNIDPDALETVGYGEQFLKIPTPYEEPENRRVTIRRITPLVGQR